MKQLDLSFLVTVSTITAIIFLHEHINIIYYFYISLHENIGCFMLFCLCNVYFLYLELQYLNFYWQYIVFHICSKGTLLKAYINFISFVGHGFRNSWDRTCNLNFSCVCIVLPLLSFLLYVYNFTCSIYFKRQMDSDNANVERKEENWNWLNNSSLSISY